MWNWLYVKHAYRVAVEIGFPVTGASGEGEWIVRAVDRTHAEEKALKLARRLFRGCPVRAARVTLVDY